MPKDIVIYDYVSINVKSDLEEVYIDFYKNFGWIHIKNEIKTDYYINTSTSTKLNLDIVNIKFKRGTNIKDKEKLKILQQKCEKAFLEIYKLEKQQQSIATICSLNMAFFSTILIVIAVFLEISNKNMWLLSSFLGVIGLVGLVFPYFVYKKVKNKIEIKNKLKIDEKKNIISEIYIQVKEIFIEY